MGRGEVCRVDNPVSGLFIPVSSWTSSFDEPFVLSLSMVLDWTTSWLDWSLSLLFDEVFLVMVYPAVFS